MTQKEIEILSPEESWTMLGQQTVGRFVYADRSGLAAIPVNYALNKEQIVFRINDASHLREVLQTPCAFEVDDLHPDEGTGWSVLARGQAREVPLEDVPALVTELNKLPHPIVEGTHNVWIALTPNQVTGRRLGAPFVGTVF